MRDWLGCTVAGRATAPGAAHSGSASITSLALLSRECAEHKGQLPWALHPLRLSIAGNQYAGCVVSAVTVLAMCTLIHKVVGACGAAHVACVALRAPFRLPCPFASCALRWRSEIDNT